ncbi:MAG TPA: hypothetical protein VK654_06585 [Nitrospirota bacterium]|nr:hypothetical protein [Nitrospirota bacterium]
MYVLFFVFIVLLFIVGLSVRSSDRYLKTDHANFAEVRGTFVLLLCGPRASGELVSVAILDREGDAYTFKIAAPEFSYGVQPGLTAADALQKAEKFVKRHIQSEGVQLRKVLGPGGGEIGFELKPLYPVTAFGRDDIIDVRYEIKERNVTVHIALDSAVEKQAAG